MAIRQVISYNSFKINYKKKYLQLFRLWWMVLLAPHNNAFFPGRDLVCRIALSRIPAFLCRAVKEAIPFFRNAAFVFTTHELAR